MADSISATDKYDKAELRLRLDPIAYQVTQEKGTEKPFTNKYYKHYESGVYTCVVCGDEMFTSDTKYESGSGWPAFYDVMDKTKVKFQADSSGVGPNLLRIVANPHLIRTEVSCKKCGSHLGHVFPDGPKPTGKRYCVNSSSLNFCARTENPDEEQQEQGTDEIDKAKKDPNDSKPEGENAKVEEKKEKKILNFPATINGCGKDGFCAIKPKPKLLSNKSNALNPMIYKKFNNNNNTDNHKKEETGVESKTEKLEQKTEQETQET